MKRINRPLEKVPSSNFIFSQKKKKGKMSDGMEYRGIFSE